MIEHGTIVTYHDCDEVIKGDSVCTGHVNGDTIYLPDSDLYYVPVWSERDNGREATTIYVKSTNILKTEIKGR